MKTFIVGRLPERILTYLDQQSSPVLSSDIHHNIAGDKSHPDDIVDTRKALSALRRQGLVSCEVCYSEDRSKDNRSRFFWSRTDKTVTRISRES